MKRLFFFSLVLFALTSCDEYMMRKQTLAEYTEVFSKIQELEKVLNTADFKTMSGPELLSIHSIGSELYYDYNPLGLKPEHIVACDALKARVSALRTELVKKAEAQVAGFMVNTYNSEDVLLEKKETYPVYLIKGEKLRWNIHGQKPMTVRLCNADARTVIKTYTDKTAVVDSITIPNTAIYFLEVNPKGTQYVDVNVNYKINDFSRLKNVVAVKAEQVECAPGDFGAVAVPGVKMQPIFEQPRKFTLRGQLKALVSGSSTAMVPVMVPSGTTDILYSVRIATSEQDRYSDGEFYENISTSYKKVKFMGLPLYEKASNHGLINTLLDDNRPLQEEDAYCNMYVFRNYSDAKKFQDGSASASELKYDLDYSIVGTQSCNGRVPTNGATKVYLGFENVRVRYLNYIWVEAIAVVPTTEYYTMKYSIN
jgi:hypothetical protein